VGKREERGERREEREISLPRMGICFWSNVALFNEEMKGVVTMMV